MILNVPFLNKYCQGTVLLPGIRNQMSNGPCPPWSAECGAGGAESHCKSTEQEGGCKEPAASLEGGLVLPAQQSSLLL